MIWKLCRIFILLVPTLLFVTDLVAQDSYNVELLSQYSGNWLDAVTDVAVSGNFAYLSCGREGVRVLDISDPSNIREIGGLTDISTNVLALSGSMLLVGSFNERNNPLYVVDVSNPAAPIELSRLPVGYIAHRIRIHDTIAVLCSNNPGLTFVDISNPSAPSILWTSTGTGFWEASDIEFHGNTAWVSCAGRGLRKYDVTSLGAPLLLDSFLVNEELPIMGACVRGDLAYLASSFNGFQVLNLNTRQVVASVDSLFFAFELEVHDQRAYVHYGEFECPIAEVDITNPLAPRIESVYYPPQDLSHFTVIGTTAYVAAYFHGLRVVDWTTPATPLEIGRYNHCGRYRDALVRNNLAYVREDYKLRVLDISNLASPSELGYFETPGMLADFAVIGTQAYLLEVTGPAIYSVNFSDPTAPALSDAYRELSRTAGGLAIYGNYAYLADACGYGISVMDLTDPHNLHIVADVGYENGTCDLAVYDHFLYFQDAYFSLRALDITNPFQPTPAGSVNLVDPTWCLSAGENLLCVLTVDRVMLFDATEFLNWRPFWTRQLLHSLDHHLHEAEIVGNHLYIVGDSIGLEVYDLSNPRQPVLTGYSRRPQTNGGLTALPNGLSLVGNDRELCLFDCSAAMPAEPGISPALPRRISLFENYPNPFNSETVIPFELPRTTEVTFAVFDANGRKVCTVANRTLPAGHHQLRWNGLNGNGVPVASGRYFVVLASGGTVQSRPMMLLK